MNLLFLGTTEEAKYLPYLKPFFAGITTYTVNTPIEYLTLLVQYCQKRNITGVITTSVPILDKLLAKIGTFRGTPKLSEYAGSLFVHEGIEIVIVPPLAQIFTVPYGKFLLSRYISKLTHPQNWRSPSPFKYTLLDERNYSQVLEQFNDSLLMAVDIETAKDPLRITRMSYSCLNPDGSIDNYTMEMNSEWAVAAMRNLNRTRAPKITQNGKYDNSYFLAWHAPLHNWLGDTATAFHATFSEMPKDLAFLNAFYLREVIYWKDLASSLDLADQQEYAAKDTWATLNIFISWILTAPPYAMRNFILEFPLLFPCLLAEMTGVIRDEDRLKETRKQVSDDIKKHSQSLEVMTATPGFNSNSPPQVKKLLQVFGIQDAESSDEKSLNTFSFRHPVIARVLNSILEVRGLRKLLGTYLRTAEDKEGSKDFKGRVLYSLNPHGTDSGRLASNEHAFWCGFNIQNIPRGPEVKRTIRAAPGFYLAECDLEQAESRDTANISGDDNLIFAVTADHDFHSYNASAFFGKPYEEIYDPVKKKTKDKALRDTAKRVNHGANYNMGPDVLVTTMGLKAVYAAGAALKLPFSAPVLIAEYLLLRFHETYPKLRGRVFCRNLEVIRYAGIPQGEGKHFAPGTYYASVAQEIKTTDKLTSRAYHHTPYNEKYHPDIEKYISEGDWTRYCFGDPSASKLTLNSYVAHAPQSLNARTLNEAFLRVFLEVALTNPDTFRLHAQIHDSIFFSYKEGHDIHCEQVRTLMEIPVSVRDISGKRRYFTVPAAVKNGKNGVSATYWNETE